jgi:hypothetical protein
VPKAGGRKPATRQDPDSDSDPDDSNEYSAEDAWEFRAWASSSTRTGYVAQKTNADSYAASRSNEERVPSSERLTSMFPLQSVYLFLTDSSRDCVSARRLLQGYWASLAERL